MSTSKFASGAGKEAGDLVRAVNLFMSQNSPRPEATDDMHERLVQLMAELGRLASGYQWGEPKEKLQQSWAQLLILAIGGCIKQGIEVDAVVKERLAKLPGMPMPTRQKGSGVRGLRL
jgi:hypothetical protein